ncbi:helix-turn-helix domain-containing protein [Candidatus Woesearchaeota archaeon]|nr:helix-turn-helix domain-containing protein [Candidatus Woesearchaeota archaeon]
MVKGILHPQEIETFYVLPTIRRHLAVYMKERGMKQKDVAALLGINSATISQYSSNKRGNLVQFNPQVLAEIKLSASKIKDHTSYLKETQRILRYIRLTKELCPIHRQFSIVPAKCDPKMMGCHALVGY